MTSKVRGYTDRSSAAQGERLAFHLSNLAGEKCIALPMHIARLGKRESAVLVASVDVSAHDPVAEPWLNNRWAPAVEIQIGLDWTPGVYAARIGSEADDIADIYFVVRNGKADNSARMIVQLPTNTINAYNNWGGKSLYNFNSDQQAASYVSFDRPQQSDPLWSRGHSFHDEWDRRIRAFVIWLEEAGLTADYIANSDLHEDAEVLSPYRLFVSIGHDEYWSLEMRSHFDAFVASGGNAAIFGGNTCLWQARLEPDERTGVPGRHLVCHRDAAADPIADPRRKTVAWSDIGFPENLSFGAGFFRGAWKGSGEGGAFRVCRPDHWVFSGIDLKGEKTFGGTDAEPLLTYETNGVDWQSDVDGRPVPTGVDGTPENYLILALAALPHWQKPGNAAMGIFSRPGGGTVFNGATTDWACGLAPCLAMGDLYATTTAKITRNVIERLTR